MTPTQKEPSTLVASKLPCNTCGSSDALAEYDDGHTHCFSCGETKQGVSSGALEGSGATALPHQAGSKPLSADLEEVLGTGSIKNLPKRGLTLATCKHFDYRIRQNRKGEWEQLAIYRDARGKPVGCKIRNTGVDGSLKKFRFVGKAEGNLFGRHLWRDQGRMIVITEGELDCLSVSQVQGNKWPVVSVPNGAAVAAKDISKNIEWLSGFDKVVLMFDMDEPGQKAAEECAAILPPGKAFIATLPDKDPSALLQEGKGELITAAIWGAKAYRPDGIVDARELTNKCLGQVPWGIPWPWEFMTLWTYGRRKAELYTFGAGTGVGKSDAMAEIVACTLRGSDKSGLREFPNEACAVFNFEAGAATTKKLIAGKLAGHRFHIPQGEGEGGDWSTEDHIRAQAYMDVELWEKGGKLFINESFGAADWDSVKDRCRFMAHAEGVTHFVIDPLGALAMSEDDERKLLDRVALEGASLAQELNASIYFVSHLTRPDGTSHEEGGRVSLKHFRGSNGIGMFSHFVFGFERDQQAENPEDRKKLLVRVLKDRYTGNSTGKTSVLIYDSISGSLDEPATSASF